MKSVEDGDCVRKRPSSMSSDGDEIGNVEHESRSVVLMTPS